MTQLSLFPDIVEERKSYNEFTEQDLRDHYIRTVQKRWSYSNFRPEKDGHIEIETVLGLRMIDHSDEYIMGLHGTIIETNKNEEYVIVEIDEYKHLPHISQAVVKVDFYGIGPILYK